MRKLAFIFLFSPTVLFCQKVGNFHFAEQVLEPTLETEMETEYLLFVHSTHRCGYCQLLRRDMAKQNIPDNVRLVFMEYDTPEEWILEADSSYLGAEVRRFPETWKSKVKIFPTSQLVRARDSSIVKRYKGYPFDFWEDVFRRADN